MMKNYNLVRPCAVFVERLSDDFVPSKRYKVDADLIYEQQQPPHQQHRHHQNVDDQSNELSVDVLVLPNNKIKISSSMFGGSDDDLSSAINSHDQQQYLSSGVTNTDIKPVVRIRSHHMSQDSNDNGYNNYENGGNRSNHRFNSSSRRNFIDTKDDDYLDLNLSSKYDQDNS
ncbi:unnamed protein product, partial [Didymodactylos carnosus]